MRKDADHDFIQGEPPLERCILDILTYSIEDRGKKQEQKVTK
jgi:hypothetical protein